MPQAAKEFIEAALARCGELGETTAREITDGTLRPWGEVEKKARGQVVGQCAVIDNATVFRWIAEALHIDALLPPEWIASFIPPCMATAANAATVDLQSNAKKPLPTQTKERVKALISVALDSFTQAANAAKNADEAERGNLKAGLIKLVEELGKMAANL